LKYRSEIDGLRAIAVIPVILFHAGFELFSGGFVGVDVFFVISGYLITTILIEDIENNRFSIVNFYERRARRILPALFFVMLVCIPFAWMWMLPNQFKDFSQSLVAVSLFASNILFWRDSGYFDAAAEEKPLLHTWSLAVEEQYYFLFPIFLILTWRFGKNKVFWMIVLFSVVSLLLSEWGWRNKANANFFLFPTRAWELLAGSITAFIVQKNGVKKNETLSLLGLAAIIFSIFYYSEATPFPSVYALVPVIGAVLLILYANKETLVAKLLSAKAFVGIGLISYSAYLWHQPLFAFAKIRAIEYPSAFLMGLLSIISLILAIISWRFIEQPFRNKNVFSRAYIPGGSFVLIMAFSLFGYLGHYTSGFVSRIPNELLISIENAKDRSETFSECHLKGDIPSHPIQQCNSFLVNNSASVMFVGDSHLDAVGLQIQKRLFDLGVGSYAVSYSGCVPIRGLYRVDMDNPHLCNEYNTSMLSYAKEKGITDIILVGRFPLYLNGDRYHNGEGGVELGQPAFVDTIERRGKKSAWDDMDRIERVANKMRDELKDLSSDFRVIVFTPTPEVGWNAPMHYTKYFMYADRDLLSNPLTHSFSNYKERILDFQDIVDNVNSQNLFQYDTSKNFCNEFTSRCLINFGPNLLYRDDDHLSSFGVKIVAKDFIEKFGSFFDGRGVVR
jgi:peptidoglycan/LPS O-acetylase OafA/YrhL